MDYPNLSQWNHRANLSTDSTTAGPRRRKDHRPERSGPNANNPAIAL